MADGVVNEDNSGLPTGKIFDEVGVEVPQLPISKVIRRIDWVMIGGLILVFLLVILSLGLDVLEIVYVHTKLGGR